VNEGRKVKKGEGRRVQVFLPTGGGKEGKKEWGGIE
jgi:hypothetical protein